MQVATFEWQEAEDDSLSRSRVLQELEAQLSLPENVSVIRVERQVLVQIDTQRQQKRTKITAKTDYVVILKDVLTYTGQLQYYFPSSSCCLKQRQLLQWIRTLSWLAVGLPLTGLQ